MPACFSLLINTVSQNLPVPRASQAEALLKYNPSPSDYSLMRSTCRPIHGVLKRWDLISEKTKLREKENAYLHALKNYNIT